MPTHGFSAAAFLYEKMGNFQEAVGLYLHEMKTSVQELEAQVGMRADLEPFDEASFPNCDAEKVPLRTAALC